MVFDFLGVFLMFLEFALETRKSMEIDDHYTTVPLFDAPEINVLCVEIDTVCSMSSGMYFRPVLVVVRRDFSQLSGVVFLRFPGVVFVCFC